MKELPTIGAERKHGTTRIRIFCDDIHCFHSEVMEVEKLGLPDSVPIIYIPCYRKFVCTRYGGGKIGVRSEPPPAPGTPGYKG